MTTPPDGSKRPRDFGNGVGAAGAKKPRVTGGAGPARAAEMEQAVVSESDSLLDCDRDDVTSDAAIEVEKLEVACANASGESAPTTLQILEERLRNVEKLESLYADQFWRLVRVLHYRCAGDDSLSRGSKAARDLRADWEGRDRGSDAEDSTRDIPSASDAENLVLSDVAGRPPARADVQSDIASWSSERRRALVLEHAAAAATACELDGPAALGALCGARGRYLIRRAAVSVGRSTKAKPVDVDLSAEPGAKQVSREHAHVALCEGGSFAIENLGRHPLRVNGREVGSGRVAALPHLSLVEVGDVPLLFVANAHARARIVRRAEQARREAYAAVCAGNVL
ncbi:unnamed protein product [Pedinophyceae sp. YPF-701]|nr:unnamed protein product [Pedinophyceae sp. YPF-701]